MPHPLNLAPDCTICHEPLARVAEHSSIWRGRQYKVSSDLDVVCSQYCFHLFHEHCIKPWIEQGKKCPTCPLFRLRESELIPFPDYNTVLQRCLNGDGLDKDQLRPSCLQGKAARRYTRQEVLFHLDDVSSKLILVLEQLNDETNLDQRAKLEERQADLKEAFFKAGREWEKEISDWLGDIDKSSKEIAERLDAIASDYEKMCRLNKLLKEGLKAFDKNLDEAEEKLNELSRIRNLPILQESKNVGSPMKSNSVEEPKKEDASKPYSKISIFKSFALLATISAIFKFRVALWNWIKSWATSIPNKD